MIKMEKYNGWTNRETWLFNLHFGEIISEAIQSQAVIDMDDLESYAQVLIDSSIDELETALESVSGFVADTIDNTIGKVDIDEIVESHREELEDLEL